MITNLHLCLMEQCGLLKQGEGGEPGSAAGGIKGDSGLPGPVGPPGQKVRIHLFLH